MALNWRQQQKVMLRQHLYETALALFVEQGYEQTTVQQITEKASVAKGTFFNHFPSKEHVIEEWYNLLTEESLNEVKDASFASAREGIEAIVDCMTVRVLEAPELVDVKARIVHTSSLLSDAERKQDEEVGAFFLKQIRAGKQSGEIDPALDELFFADTLVALLTGTARGWVRSRHSYDIRETIKKRIEFLFRAAAPQPGPESNNPDSNHGGV